MWTLTWGVRILSLGRSSIGQLMTHAWVRKATWGSRRSIRATAVSFVCLVGVAAIGLPTGAYADEPIINIDIDALDRVGGQEDSGAIFLDQMRTAPERGLGVQTNILSDGAIEAGPGINSRPGSDVADDGSSLAGPSEDDALDVGGFVGYRFQDFGGEASSLGINLQMLGDPFGSESGWAVTPGIDYSTPIDGAWRLDARVFSSYGREGGGFGNGSNADDDAAAGLRAQEDPGFQDFGFSLGLGYSVADQWSVLTSAGYARARQNGQERAAQDEEEWSGEFFGGVMLNYRF